MRIDFYLNVRYIISNKYVLFKKIDKKTKKRLISIFYISDFVFRNMIIIFEPIRCIRRKNREPRINR